MYAAIVAAFAGGAVIGGFATHAWSVHAIWIPAGLLAVTLVLFILDGRSIRYGVRMSLPPLVCRRVRCHLPGRVARRGGATAAVCWTSSTTRRPLSFTAAQRARNSLWRYESVLPVPFDEQISLGEGMSPIVRSRTQPNVRLKLDFLMPTLSFKDRGAVVLATLAPAWACVRH